MGSRNYELSTITSGYTASRKQMPHLTTVSCGQLISSERQKRQQQQNTAGNHRTDGRMVGVRCQCQKKAHSPAVHALPTA